VSLWREHFYNVYPGGPDIKPDTKSKAFVRAFLRLHELHLIGVWQDSVWLAGQNGQTGQNGKCPADGRGGTKRTDISFLRRMSDLSRPLSVSESVQVSASRNLTPSLKNGIAASNLRLGMSQSPNIKSGCNHFEIK
jgi:hypothetical protein